MNQQIKAQSLRRLRIAEGQVRGLIEMVEREQYCVDIITQSSAVKEALSGVERLVLENHLSTHVVQQMKQGEEAKATEEILKLYRLAQRKR